MVMRHRIHQEHHALLALNYLESTVLTSIFDFTIVLEAGIMHDNFTEPWCCWSYRP